MSLDAWMLLRALASLVVVLALAVVVLRFGLPRFLQLTGRSRDRRLKLIEVLLLDRQHRLALVEAEGTEYLVGFGGGGVRLLAEWPAAASDEAPPGEEKA